MASNGLQISRNANWAIGQTIVSAVVLFVLYKFLLVELGASKLGLWSLILASTSLAKLGELGFSNATVRFVGKYIGEGKPQDAAEVLETSLISISLPFLAISTAAIPLLGFALPLFVPDQHMADALIIVPWAMIALWLGVTSGLVQSAIDGYGRMDQKNMILIATNLIYMAFAIYLATNIGLKGVAIAQVIQAGTSLLLMWLLARRHLRALPLLPMRWRKNRFIEISGFALTMQTASIAGMFVEPITKALISRFSGLEFLAFYEMANQVVSRARAVLISGFQAIIPQFSINKEPSKHKEIFLQSQRKVIVMGIPFMTLIMIALPVISQLWIGRIESSFIISGQILGVTWLILTLLMPAYFYLVGTGRGAPVAVAQLIALAGTGAFAWLGGSQFKPVGPVAGAAIALLVGNLYLYWVAIKGLFRVETRLVIPTWIYKQMLARGFSCLAIIGTHLLATHNTSGLVGHLVVLLAFATVTISLAFVSRNSVELEQ